jgi:autotransporter-associated beta strand protein
MRKSTKTNHMLFLTCAAGAFAIGRAVPAQASTNLLLDPDFEAADGGQDASSGDVPMGQDAFGDPQGPWYGWNNWVAPYTAFYTTTIPAHSGTQVAKTFSGPYGGVYQYVAANPGDSYNASCWFYDYSGDALNGAETDDVRLIFQNGAGATLATDVCPVPFLPVSADPADPMNTWQQFSVTAVAPPGTTKVQWMAFFNNPGYAGGSLFVDDGSLIDLGSGPVVLTWNGAGSDAHWTDANNWGGTAPSATNTLAFAGTTNLNPNNDFPAGLQFNGIQFNSGAGAFTLSGNAINLGGDVVNNSTSLQTIGIGLTLLQNTNFNTAAGDIAVSGAIGGGFNINKLGSGTLTLSGANNYSGATTVTAGTLKLTPTGTISSSSSVTVGTGSTGTAALVLQAGSSGIQAYTVPALSIGSNGTVTVALAGSDATRSVLVTPSLGFAGSFGLWAGKMDLANNDLIVQGGGAASLTNITNQIKQGFNAGAGYWNGAAGIVSSAAAASSGDLTALGSRLSPGGLVDGISTTTNDVLVKYTYYGDANLDGTVSGADYQQIDMGYGMHLTGWSNGDFNYDGVVDGSDFSLIDNAYNQINATGAGPLAIVASPADLISSAAVPEPTAIGLLGVGAISLLSRRRRGVR